MASEDKEVEARIKQQVRSQLIASATTVMQRGFPPEAWLFQIKEHPAGVLLGEKELEAIVALTWKPTVR